MNTILEDKFTVSDINKDGKFFKKGTKMTKSEQNRGKKRDLRNRDDARHQLRDLRDGEGQGLLRGALFSAKYIRR